MPNPFRFPSLAAWAAPAAAAGNGSSNDRGFAFRRSKGRRLSDSSTPLATCTYDAMSEEEEIPFDCDPAPSSTPSPSLAAKTKQIQPLFAPSPEAVRDNDDSSVDSQPECPSGDRKRKLNSKQCSAAVASRRDDLMQPRRLEPRTPPSLFTSPPKPAKSLHDRFRSILDRPFQYWQELNLLLKEMSPEWTAYQRGRMIHHLVHFLELKVGLDEYVATGLLLPSRVVEDAWKALVLETSLYLNVTYAIQDFHGKEREMIHYTFLLNRKLPPKEAEDKLRRTQTLFHVYFKETMPLHIDDEPRDPPPPRTVCTKLKHSPTKTNSNTPVFGSTPTMNYSNHSSSSASESPAVSDAIFEFSSLNIQQPPITTNKSADLSPMSSKEDRTAETQSMYSSSAEESEGLMGLELVE